MGTLTERLEFFLSMNSEQAVQGFKNVGDAADANLKKASGGLEQTGTKLIGAGAGMLAFGAVAAVGLGKFAEASDNAEVVQIKLANSVEHSTQMGQDATKAFDDLATSIMHKTVVDDEQVKSAESMLVQFGLTQAQVETLTPLVVDLSRKMGVDMDAAAKSVGKSVEGSTGALSKMGIMIDPAKASTDAFGATVDALRGKVGGFAESEAQTFSGRVQQMKVQLGEIAEGVGPGVVSVFEDMLGPVKSVTDWFAHLDPSTQSLIGKFAAMGATGIGAVGAMSMLAGTVMKLQGNLTKLVEVEGEQTRVLNGWGKAGAVGVAVAGLAALYEVGKQLEASQWAKIINADVKALNAEGLEPMVDRIDKVYADMDKMATSAQGAGIHFDATKDVLKQFNDTIDKTPALGQKFIDAAAASGKVGTDTLNQMKDALDKKRASDIQGAQAQQDYNQQIQDGLEAQKEAASATDITNSALAGLNTQHDVAATKAQMAKDAEKELTDQYDKETAAIGRVVDATLASIDTNLAQQQAESDFKEKVKDTKATMLEKEQALQRVIAATLANKEAMDEANGTQLTATEKAQLAAQAYHDLATQLGPNSELGKWAQDRATDMDALAKKADIPAPVAPDFGATTAAFKGFADDVRSAVGGALPDSDSMKNKAADMWAAVQRGLDEKGPVRVAALLDTDSLTDQLKRWGARNGVSFF